MKYATWLVALLFLAIGSAMIFASSADTPYTLDLLLMEEVAFNLAAFAADHGFKIRVQATEFARNERGFAAISPISAGEAQRLGELSPVGRSLAAVYLDPTEGSWPEFEAGHYVVQLLSIEESWRVVLVDGWGRVRASGEARLGSSETGPSETSPPETGPSRSMAEVSIRPESEGCRLVYRSPELVLETWLG